MTPNSRAAAVVLTLGLWVGASACGGDPEVCGDVDTLRADVDDLRAIEIQPGALAEFSAALEDVRADVDQVVESAGSEYDAEVDVVRSTTQALAASVETAVQDPSGETVTQVSSDFGAFTTAVGDLGDAVGDTC